VEVIPQEVVEARIAENERLILIAERELGLRPEAIDADATEAVDDR
jgi:hypothetical protein